jgi:HK97 family phage major capsid protein
VRQTTTNEWNGVTSAGASAHWRAEAAEVADDAITLAQPNIPVHRMDVFIPYSIEIEMDWAQFEQEMRDVMMDAKDNLEATAHISGTGSTQPTGLVTALTGTASEIDSLTAEVFAQADVFNIRRQLPPRHRRTREQPSWLATIGTYDDIRQFDTGGGGGFWTDMMDGTPDRLLSYSTYDASAMDDSQDIDAAATATHRVLIVGDLKKYYIVDRIGMFMETVPHLFATGNNRPSGQRGLLAFMRTGADSVDDNAFRMLKVTTTA